MERQLCLNLSDPEERAESVRKFLSPLNFPKRHVEVFCALAAHGTRENRNGQSISTLCVPKSRVPRIYRGSANTWLKSMEELESQELAAIVRLTTPWTFVVNWSRLGKLETVPIDPLSGLELLDPNWVPTRSGSGQSRSAPVSPGQSARDSVNALHSKSVSSVSVSVAEGTCAANRPRPWDRHGGITDAELVVAVTCRELSILRRLYDEAIALGWIERCEEKMLHFLTICHHAATSAGIHKRMGTLVARMKQKCRVDSIPQRSHDWAAAILAARHRDPTLAREEAGVRT